MKKSVIIVLGVIGLVMAVLVGADLSGSNPDLLILSDKNTVSLNTPITDGTVAALQVELMEKSNKLSKNVPIILTLDSPGGSIDAGMKLIETAKGLKQEVATLSMFSASMSFITSQYLGKRYVMKNSTLMSHRAYLAGVEGQIPGSFLSRTNSILEVLIGNDQFIASRAGMDLEGYEKIIANELWMDGKRSVDMKFADKLVRVRCDSSLQGPGKVKKIDILTFTISITYHKCPLVTEPLSIELGSANMTAEADHVWQMYLNDKPAFIKEYIETGKFNSYVK